MLYFYLMQGLIRVGIEQDNTDIWVILILLFIYSVMVHTIF
jgi:hypothetical protein